jgi:hypothetical protein
MRSYHYAALKLAVDGYEHDAGKFASLLNDIVTFGAQQRGDRDAFVLEVAHAVGQPILTVERWLVRVSSPHPAASKLYLQHAFDQILKDRSA